DAVARRAEGARHEVAVAGRVLGGPGRDGDGEVPLGRVHVERVRVGGGRGEVDDRPVEHGHVRRGGPGHVLAEGDGERHRGGVGRVRGGGGQRGGRGRGVDHQPAGLGLGPHVPGGVGPRRGHVVGAGREGRGQGRRPAGAAGD